MTSQQENPLTFELEKNKRSGDNYSVACHKQVHATILEIYNTIIVDKSIESSDRKGNCKINGSSVLHEDEIIEETESSFECDPLDITNNGTGLVRNMDSTVSPRVEYCVDKILKSRTTLRQFEYLVKLKNCLESDCIWVPVDKLNCFDLILKFEHKRQKAKKQLQTAALKVNYCRKIRSQQCQKAYQKPVRQRNCSIYEINGRSVEKIINEDTADDAKKATAFHLKFKDSDVPETVPAFIVKKYMPNLVSDYYSNKLQ